MMRLIAFVFLLSSNSVFAQKVEIAFRLSEKDLIPEGIAYDAATKAFYISSIHKNKIVKVDAQQRASDFTTTAQDGLGQVLGMKVVNGKLWACSNSAEGNEKGMAMVHQYDVATGKLIQKWIFPFAGEKHLFNDLVITKHGDAFISDSDFGAVYRVHASLTVPELWLKHDRLRDINGIALLGDQALVVNASIGFFRMEIETKEFKSLPFGDYFPIGIDGLSTYEQSLVGIQNIIYPVSVNQYYLNNTRDAITKARVLVADHPDFEIPTTGVVVGNWFYFIANSQMRKLEKDKIKDPSKLNDTLILKVSLN